MNTSSLLLMEALNGKRTDRTPVWLMRQAGRSDPEYRAIRDRNPIPLEDLFRNVETCVEISLLPKRIGVDGIIFFQDILTPLTPMGAKFYFRPGPVLENPIRKREQILDLCSYHIDQELAFAGETLQILHDILKGQLPVIGFAGAPVTLLFFLVEGKSPGNAPHALSFLREEPTLSHLLLNKLTKLTIDYLRFQIACGAQVVQVFESVADHLSPSLFEEYSLPYLQTIFSELQDTIPKIFFAKGFPHPDLMAQTGADALSISSQISLSECRNQITPNMAIQGNVSNMILADESPETIREAVMNCIREGQHLAHVLNLDHGVLSHTPWENVITFVDTALNYRLPGINQDR